MKTAKQFFDEKAVLETYMDFDHWLDCSPIDTQEVKLLMWIDEYASQSQSPQGDREKLIDFGTKERTRAKKIAYEFYDKYNQEALSLSKIGGETNKMLSDRRKQLADIARQIGNAISGSNALSGNETIQDRVTIEVDNYLKIKTKGKE